MSSGREFLSTDPALERYPIALRSAMVVAAFVWIIVLAVVVPNRVLYAASASIDGVLVAASVGVAITLAITLVARRRVLSPRRWHSILWYVTALVWYPIGVLFGNPPGVALIFVFGIPLLFASEMILRRRHASPTKAGTR